MGEFTGRSGFDELLVLSKSGGVVIVCLEAQRPRDGVRVAASFFDVRRNVPVFELTEIALHDQRKAIVTFVSASVCSLCYVRGVSVQ